MLNIEQENRGVEYSAVRALERWKSETFEYSGADCFEARRSLAKGVHTIFESGYPIDVYIDLKPGCPLVIFLNGAVPRSDSLKLPVFAGFGVVPDGDVSRVCINDAGLYLSPDLPLAWYAGSAGLPLQAILPRIIGTVVGIAATKQVMFAGGSGGGFASLYYSRMVPGSLVVAWNPQTNILKYAPKHVMEYASASFGLVDFEAVKTQLPRHIDVDLCALYEDRPSNHILYLQNASDWHVNSHCRPFLKAVGHTLGDQPVSDCLDAGLYLHMGEWGAGHAAPPNPFLKSLMAGLLAHKGGWSDLFASKRIREILPDKF